jgi:glycerol kinase
MAENSGNILAIDQGTTNTKVLLVDRNGQIIARGSRPLEQTYPHPAWVEQDATAIWQSVQEAINECLSSIDEPRLAAIAITNQRESVVAWDRSTGQPVGPVIVWQCRRTTNFCARLRERGLGQFLAERTGLAIDPLFSASKMNWLLNNIPDGHRRAEHGQLCLGTMDSWVLWKLTGGKVHACDLTNASRTQLLDIHQLNWGEELLELFEVPSVALPEVRPSRADFGASIAIGRLPAGVPIRSMIGDSHAALFGQAGFRPGTVKATYGTGSSLMTPTATPVLSEHGLSTTIAWALDQEHVTYALEGNITVTGAAVQWLGEFLGLKNSTEEVAKLAESVTGADGVYLVPAFAGLGAPYWNPTARGLVSGLTRGSTAAHLARATIEAIAYQVRDVFDLMQVEAGTDMQVLLADGGASRNRMLMQFQSDIIGCKLWQNASVDASSLGASYLAGLASGIWERLEEIEQLPRPRTVYEPGMSEQDRSILYSGWKAAIARTTLDI